MVHKDPDNEDEDKGAHQFLDGDSPGNSWGLPRRRFGPPLLLKKQAVAKYRKWI